jgi:hypothetical protein
MPAVLDTSDLRPLTSREISRILCGVVGCMAMHDDRVCATLPLVLEQIAQNSSNLETLDMLANRDAPAVGAVPTWASALGATVAGLMGWCKPTDVRTAVIWTRENLDTIFTMVGARDSTGN